ncbi:hypothetical protein AHAS_Ahas15G0093400 [Arachis hypogaea]
MSFAASKALAADATKPKAPARLNVFCPASLRFATLRYLAAETFQLLAHVSFHHHGIQFHFHPQIESFGELEHQMTRRYHPDLIGKNADLTATGTVTGVEGSNRAGAGGKTLATATGGGCDFDG